MLPVVRGESVTMLNRTRDDAIGETFDKVAKFVGLPYPGGPQIEKCGRDGRIDRARFPFPLPQFKATSGLDWSLGGFIAGLTGRFVSSFDECSNPYDPTTAQGGICQVPSGTTTVANPNRRRVQSFYQLDVHAGYTLNSKLGKTSFYVGVLNLTDKSPPYIYSAALANSDPSTYDYIGRYVYGRIQQRF